jgi:hypothetical protein
MDAVVISNEEEWKQHGIRHGLSNDDLTRFVEQNRAKKYGTDAIEIEQTTTTTTTTLRAATSTTDLPVTPVGRTTHKELFNKSQKRIDDKRAKYGLNILPDTKPTKTKPAQGNVDKETAKLEKQVSTTQEKLKAEQVKTKALQAKITALTKAQNTNTKRLDTLTQSLKTNAVQTKAQDKAYNDTLGVVKAALKSQEEVIQKLTDALTAANKPHVHELTPVEQSMARLIELLEKKNINNCNCVCKAGCSAACSVAVLGELAMKYHNQEKSAPRRLADWFLGREVNPRFEKVKQYTGWLQNETQGVSGADVKLASAICDGERRRFRKLVDWLCGRNSGDRILKVGVYARNNFRQDVEQ